MEDAGCGLNGELCAPLMIISLDIRCPVEMRSRHAPESLVGNKELDFVPLLAGGGHSQKKSEGDSFICSSAIRARVLSSSCVEPCLTRYACSCLISDSVEGPSVQLIWNFSNVSPATTFGLTSVDFSRHVGPFLPTHSPTIQIPGILPRPHEHSRYV